MPFLCGCRRDPGLSTSRVKFKGRLGQVTAWGAAAIGHEVVYTVRGVSSMHVSVARLRCLYEGPLHSARIDSDGRGSLAELSARAITKTLTSKSPTLAAARMLHYSLRRWFARAFDLEFEALQTPCTMTTGIFPGKPRLAASAVPKEDQLHRDAQFDDPTAEGWENEAFPGSCMVCIREGNHELMKKVVIKACVSASLGKRCLVILEKGRGECLKDLGDITKPPASYDLSVKRRLVVEFPRGRVLWTDTNGWSGVAIPSRGWRTCVKMPAVDL